MKERFYSADDLMRLSFLPENRLIHLELRDGSVIERPMFGGQHGSMCATILEVITPGSTQRLTMDDTLEGGDVLPGFTLPVRTIFET